MKIQNIWFFHPYAGGPEFGNSLRAFQLASLWSLNKHTVTVFCSSWHHLMKDEQIFKNMQTLNGVRYAFVSARKYNGNGFSRLMNMYDFCKNILFEYKYYMNEIGTPSIIIVSSPHPYTILSAKIIADRVGAKLIFEVRDLWPLSLKELAGLSNFNLIVLLTSLIEKFAYRHVDACVSLLPNAKTYMIKCGLSPDRFHYIPNGALVKSEIKVYDINHEAVRLVQKLKNSGKFVVIYTGAMGPPNNLIPLIKAVRLLHNMKCNLIHFVLMGSGSESNLLKSMVNDYKLTNIHFYPQSSRNISEALMKFASAGYSSLKRKSIFKYGVSVNKVFEYMNYKLPIIFAADVPQNPIELSNCGIIAAPDNPNQIAEAIYSLSKKSNFELKEMGELGYQYLSKYHNYNDLSQTYMQLFEKLNP